MTYQYLATFIFFSCCFHAAHAGYYTVSAPDNVRPGQQWFVTVTVNGASGSVKVALSLSAGDTIVTRATATLGSPDAVQRVPLEIPSVLPDGDLVLTADGSGGLTFHNSTAVDQLEVATKTSAVFIQTDKAMYKPGQKVQFRVVVVDTNLKPITLPVDINLKDPNGNVIKQWLNESNMFGVYSHQLQLSDQPVQGDWAITCNVQGELTKKMLTVAEYVLPKFEVSVTLPSFHLLGDGSLAVSATAKYTYGKPVRGVAAIRLQVLQYKQYGCSYWDPQDYKTVSEECPSIALKKELNAEGQVTVTFSPAELKTLVYVPPSRAGYTQDAMSFLSYNLLFVEADVTETLTLITLSGNSTVSMTINKYRLEILDISPSTFKPHLTYYGFVKVSQVDGQPPVMTDFMMGGQPVLLSVTYETSKASHPYVTTATKVNYTVPDSGVVRISFTVPADTEIFSFTATLSPAGVKEALTAYKSVQKFMSQSDAGIQLSIVNSLGNIKATDTINFQLNSTSAVSQCFYQLLSKGALVQSGQVAAASGSVMSVQVVLTPSLAQLLSPSTTVLASCILPSGELVADSLDFNVDGAFANNVSVSFSSSQVSPADTVSVQVSASPGSYVGLLAVDQSVLLLKSGNDLSSAAILQELSSFGQNSQSGGRGDYMPGPRPRGRGKRMAIWCMHCWWPVPRGGKDTVDVLKQAGVVMMTNALMFKTPYVPVMYYDMMARGAGGGIMAEMDVDMKVAAVPAMAAAPPPNAMQDTTVVRKTFPETWLWTNNTAGKDGKVQLTATVPDTITSWIASAFALSEVTGLGLAPTAKLTVFKPFFVSLTLPYSVIRGEEFALTITVFNYLNSDINVDVTIKGSSDYVTRQVNSVDEPTHSDVVIRNIPVKANNGASEQVWVKPVTLGQVPVVVKAQSVAAADAMQQMLLVEAEGFPEEYTRPLFIDLSSVSSLTNTIDISLPPNLVVDSQFIRVTLAGDVMGPTIAGLDSLLQMPYGCGEQNMLSMVPNIYVLDYLTHTNQVTKDNKDKAITYMESGYQRELTYQRSDSSFSAFGQSDQAGSTWLTAFVVRSFQEASNYIYIDPAIITRSLSWLVTNQQSNGAFAEPPEGRVIHTDMQGGTGKGLTMTSYVLLTLLEVRKSNLIIDMGVKQQVDTAINKATSYLTSQLTTIQSDPYALAVTTYALYLAGSPNADTALAMLDKLAIIQDGVKYWTANTDSSCGRSAGWTPPSCQATALNVELNAYALLIYVTKADTATAVLIVKWLSAQRNSNGGFVSTQDTVMALMALAKFAALTSGSGLLNMDVIIKTDTGKSFAFDHLSKTNAIVMQIYEITDEVQSVTVSASGHGVAILQVSVKYNVPQVSNRPAVNLNLTSWTESERTYGIRVCTSWTDKSPSGMGLVNVNALSGTAWVNTANILKQLPSLVRRVELKGNTLSVYLDELPRSLRCFFARMEMQVPVSNMQDARAEALAYYTPDKSARQLYLPKGTTLSHCDVCPECCSSNGSSQSVVGSVTMGTSLLGVLLTLCIAALSSCLLSF